MTGNRLRLSDAGAIINKKMNSKMNKSTTELQKPPADSSAPVLENRMLAAVIPYQLCPKCNGQGTVSKPPYIAGDVYEWSGSSCQFQCDVCNGSKIIPMFILPQDAKINESKSSNLEIGVEKQVYDTMKSIIEYVDQECSVGSTSADLSHDFVDCLRSRLDKLEGVEWMPKAGQAGTKPQGNVIGSVGKLETTF